MRAIWVMATALVAGAGTSYAAEPVAGRPEVLQKLFDCRRIAEIGARAACYDAQVDAFDAAERDRRVVVVDQTEVRRARRSLFGFTLPKLRLFDGRDDKAAEAEEVQKVETTIKSARASSGGRWTIILPDDAVWVQTDDLPLSRSPKPGQPIRIRRGAMGSYLANIDGQTAIRVRREK